MHSFELTADGKHITHFFTISTDCTYADLLKEDIIEPIFFQINDDINETDTVAILRDNDKIVYLAPSAEIAYQYAKRILEMEKAWEDNIILF